MFDEKSEHEKLTNKRKKLTFLNKQGLKLIGLNLAISFILMSVCLLNCKHINFGVCVLFVIYFAMSVILISLYFTYKKILENQIIEIEQQLAKSGNNSQISSFCIKEISKTKDKTVIEQKELSAVEKEMEQETKNLIDTNQKETKRKPKLAETTLILIVVPVVISLFTGSLGLIITTLLAGLISGIATFSLIKRKPKQEKEDVKEDTKDVEAKKVETLDFGKEKLVEKNIVKRKNNHKIKENENLQEENITIL